MDAESAFGLSKQDVIEGTVEGSAFLCAMTGIDMSVIDNQCCFVIGNYFSGLFVRHPIRAMSPFCS
ncbi:hypothetical protein [Methanolacinia paynteri]|uniref:hypothetical protein n=1 Tax=Methanolacinia paynteri TaxID=230356 RepID=UPI00147040CC|nr:hypothetical protein [Methanolacinia paynteri]